MKTGYERHNINYENMSDEGVRVAAEALRPLYVAGEDNARRALRSMRRWRGWHLFWRGYLALGCWYAGWRLGEAIARDDGTSGLLYVFIIGLYMVLIIWNERQLRDVREAIPEWERSLSEWRADIEDLDKAVERVEAKGVDHE